MCVSLTLASGAIVMIFHAYLSSHGIALMFQAAMQRAQAVESHYYMPSPTAECVFTAAISPDMLISRPKTSSLVLLLPLPPTLSSYTADPCLAPAEPSVQACLGALACEVERAAEGCTQLPGLCRKHTTLQHNRQSTGVSQGLRNWQDSKQSRVTWLGNSVTCTSQQNMVS